MQIRFGLADIRAAADQCGAITHRQRRTERRQGGAAFHIPGVIGRRTAEQGGEQIEAALALRFINGQRRLALVHRRLGAADVEGGAATTLEQALGGVERIALERDDPAIDAERIIGGADLGIGLGRGGGDADADIVARGGHRLDIGTARFDRAADAAVEVERIGGTEAEIIADRAGQMLGHARGTRQRFAAADRGADLAPRLGLAQHCLRRGEIGIGDAQVGIGGQRFGDQRVEPGVVIEFPPMIGQVGIAEARTLGRLEITLRARRGRGRMLGRMIVRPGGGAGAERQCHQGCSKALTHGGSFPAWHPSSPVRP